MEKDTRRLAVVLGMLIIVLTLGACGSSNFRIGWREFSTRNGKKARYIKFDGVQKKTFLIDGAHTMKLESDIEVKKGALQMRLVSPDGKLVWNRIFKDDDHFSTTLNMPESGLYNLYIEGFDTGGSFDISWEIVE